MTRLKGFTLIELMIAVAIIALLAAVALPSYQGQLRKSRRATAQAFMMDVAQREQARFLDARSYVAVDNNSQFDDADKLRMTIPADVSTYYDVEVDVTGPPPGFTVFAVAKGAQDYRDEEDLQLRSDGFKARGDKASNTWDQSKW
jgi:type IV pilus assembly protein PilE